MDRRRFLSASAAGLTLAPGLLAAEPRIWQGALTPIATADKKRLADLVLQEARSAGASYADVRIARELARTIGARERKIQLVSATESFGCGVRVLVNGTWGFASTNTVDDAGVIMATRRAVAIAKANAVLNTEPVRLAAEQGHGEVSWKTPMQQSGFDVPLAEQCDLLLAGGDAALKAGADFVTLNLYLINEQKYFANTDGTYADQDIHRIWPTFTVTSVDKASGKFQTRNALSAPMGMGYEYLRAMPAGKMAGPATMLYGTSYDLIEDITLAAEQAKQMHSAKSVLAGKYDLVLDPSHLFLTIHESVGHPLELDRVLGYEANYAGTSFATLDKWQSKSFKYGSPIVNFTADKTVPGSLGAVGYDDEGVKTKQWPLVKDGVLVDYQKIRDQAHITGQSASDGCCYAQSWQDVQFQRMPNVSLEPGKTPMTVAQMIGGVDRGIYILGRGSYSIDQQRYNFQFGGQLFYEIRNGKIAGMLKDVAYQATTTEFWNSVTALTDQRDCASAGASSTARVIRAR